MATVDIVYAATTLPAGVTAGDLHVVINDASGAEVQAQTVAGSPAAVTFTLTAAGTYAATAQRLDSTGAALGPAVVSAAVTIAAATFDAPATVTLTLS